MRKYLFRKEAQKDWMNLGLISDLKMENMKHEKHDKVSDEQFVCLLQYVVDMLRGKGIVQYELRIIS